MTNKPIAAHCDAGCKKEFTIHSSCIIAFTYFQDYIPYRVLMIASGANVATATY